MNKFLLGLFLGSIQLLNCTAAFIPPPGGVGGGSATNAIGNSGGSGTNTVLYGSSTVAGVIYIDGSSSSATKGIQEAVSALPATVANNSIPGGGKIVLGPGVFYITSGISTPTTTNAFTLDIEGSGIGATAIVGVGDFTPIKVGQPQNGQMQTFRMRGLTLASTSTAATNLLWFNCGTSGVARAEIQFCQFAQWTRATNSSFQGTAGHFTLSTGAPTDGLPNNLTPILLDNGTSDMNSIIGCTFNFCGPLVLAGPHMVLRDNMFEHCGATAQNSTNQFPSTDIRKLNAAVILTEPGDARNGPISAGWANVGNKHWDVHHNTFVNCNTLFAIFDGFSGAHTFSKVGVEPTIEPPRIIFVASVNSSIFVPAATLTLENTRFDNTGAPRTIAAYTATNDTSWVMNYVNYANNPTITNLFAVNEQTNGVDIKGNLYVSGTINQGTTANDPGTIPNLVYRYDPSQTNLSNGARVAYLKDFSGNDRTLVSVLSPYFTNNQSVLNGYPWVDFRGDGQMDMTQPILLAQTNTMFLVVNVYNTNLNATIFANTNSSFLNANVGGGFINAGSSVNYSIQPNTWYVMEIQYANTGSFVKTNRVLCVTGTAGSQSASGLRIGDYAPSGTARGSFGLAYFLQYNRGISANEEQLVVDWLQGRFNVISSDLVGPRIKIAGAAKLAAGVATVNTSYASQTNRIFVFSYNGTGSGSITPVSVSNIVEGVSFTIFTTTTNALDTMNWMVVGK